MNKVELINKILLLYSYLEENNEDENAKIDFDDAVITLKEEYNLTLDEIL
jgi:hypothetical protein